MTDSNAVTDEMIKDDPKFKELLDRLRKQSPDQIQRLQEFLDNLSDLPPYPPKNGHKFAADREKISITLDRNLLTLLEKTRNSLGLSMSRMVETAVWEFFDRPPLSFE